MATPTKISKFYSTDVACGYYHSVAITHNILYSWGKNDWGQLGLRHFEPKESFPKRVQFVPNQHSDEMFTSKEMKKFQIKQVQCGCYHTLAISVENNIYTFGRNSHG